MHVFYVYNYFKEPPSMRMFMGISNDILHLVIAVILFAFLVKTLCIYSDIAQDYTRYKPHKDIYVKKQFFSPLSALAAIQRPMT